MPTLWSAYNDAHRDRPARDLCLQVSEFTGPGAGRIAIDLGCGTGADTNLLLSTGWIVHAIDGAPGTTDRVLHATDAAWRDSLTVVEAEIDIHTRLPTADLIYAGLFLPFLHPTRFQTIWTNITAAIHPGGWFAGNFFGDRDSWASDEAITTTDEGQLRALFDGFEIRSLVEQEFDGRAFAGPKHWHRFDVIARRNTDLDDDSIRL